MTVPSWPQERLDRWDHLSRRWLRVGAVMLVAAAVLPLPETDSAGRFSLDWWFTDSGSDEAQEPYGLPDRTPRTLLFLALGLWVVRCASLQPLARRGRLVATASAALTVFFATRSAWGDMWPCSTDGYPGVLLAGWQAVALPALGLLLLHGGVARRLGRGLCALAGGLIVAFERWPERWTLDHFEWVDIARSQDAAGRGWLTSVILGFAAGLALLALGLVRPPRRWIEFLAPRLWAAGVLAIFLTGLVYAGREAGVEPSPTVLVSRLISHPLLIAREYGHYLVTVVGLFLWIAMTRRPASEPTPTPAAAAP